MQASTVNLGVFLAVALAVVLVPQPVLANRPVVGVAPLSHSSPNVRAGLAELLTDELFHSGLCEVTDPLIVAGLLEEDEENGRGQLTHATYPMLNSGDLARFAETLDYLLTGEVIALTTAPREDALEVSNDFKDLGKLFGASNHLAQATFRLRLHDVATGEVVAKFIVEGVESRRGEELKTLTAGLLAATDFTSEQFRGTNIGYAVYKAIGEALRELSAELPVEGLVLAISGNTVVIDLGASSGVVKGDEIMIFESNGIANSAGVTVWPNEVRVGSAEVIEVRSDSCLCMIIDGWLEIEEGDLVRPLATRLTLPTEVDPRE